jgi:hypothetical protein
LNEAPHGDRERRATAGFVRSPRARPAQRADRPSAEHAAGKRKPIALAKCDTDGGRKAALATNGAVAANLPARLSPAPRQTGNTSNRDLGICGNQSARYRPSKSASRQRPG